MKVSLGVCGREVGEDGCWRPFINNKFFTYPKVYFLVYEVFYLLHLLHGFLLLSKHRKEIQTRRNGNYEKQKKMMALGLVGIMTLGCFAGCEARAMARVQTVKGTAAKDLYII